MNPDILFFLLGYPLSIFANLHTDYIKSKLKKYKPEPLKDLFIKAFFKSLSVNEKKVDAIGQESIRVVEKAIKKDKEKLFQIIQAVMGEDNSKIFDLRSNELMDGISEAILEEFDLANISLAKAVINDCLNEYELSFFSELTQEDGIHFLTNNLRKLNSVVATRSDINNLRDFLVDELAKHESNKVVTVELRDLLYEELANPVSQQFSDSIVSYMGSLKKKV